MDVNGATCGYGLGVMISASQADDSGSIPGSRTNLHTSMNPKNRNNTRAHFCSADLDIPAFIAWKSLR